MTVKFKRILGQLRQITRTKRKFVILVLAAVGVVLLTHGVVYAAKGGRSTVYLNDVALGGNNSQQMTTELMQQLGTLRISAHRLETSRDIASLGVVVEEASFESDISKAWNWERFIPIWGTKKLLTNRKIQPTYAINEEQLYEGAIKLAGELQIEPVNASLSLEGEEVVVAEDKEGARYSADAVFDAIKNYYSSGAIAGELYISGDMVQPGVTQEVLAAVAERYEAIAGKELTVIIDDQRFRLSPDQITSLIDIEADDIALNKTAVEGLIVDWSEFVAVTPGITRITYVDDVVTERLEGTQGKFIDTSKVMTVLENWMRNPQSSEVRIAVTIAQPEVIEERSYTNTSAGLENMIRQWARSNGGEYWVSVDEIGGRNRSASYDASTPVVMASTYKMFLATVAYRMIENNELSANTIIDGGKNVEQCIEGGIVNSENTCMVALGWHIGWGKVDSVIANLGFSSVRLNNYHANGSFNGDKTAPASAQTKLLAQLANGSLLNSAHSNSLLSYMKIQMYRSGIPAGSSGIVVANKVGFLYNYLHDMAIVYGPNSTYVVTILSENASWSKVADLASDIYTFLNN